MADFFASAGFESGFGSPTGGLDLGFGDPTWDADVVYGTGFSDPGDPTLMPWAGSTGGGFIALFPPTFVLAEELAVGEEGGYLLTLQTWVPLPDGNYRVTFTDYLDTVHPLGGNGGYSGIAGQGHYLRPTYGGYALIVATPPMHPDEYTITVHYPSGATSVVPQVLLVRPLQACAEADRLASRFPSTVFNTNWHKP